VNREIEVYWALAIEAKGLGI